MKLKTQYLAMFSDKKYLSEYGEFPKSGKLYYKRAKRKNAVRFNNRKELQTALIKYLEGITKEKVEKVIVLEELILQTN